MYNCTMHNEERHPEQNGDGSGLWTIGIGVFAVTMLSVLLV
ncbi:MAG TPA: hypothetical protein VIN59_03040 [Alphaproteobacteria bacterium]